MLSKKGRGTERGVAAARNITSARNQVENYFVWAKGRFVFPMVWLGSWDAREQEKEKTHLPNG